jgi:Tol biopolymer transport system component
MNGERPNGDIENTGWIGFWRRTGDYDGYKASNPVVSPDGKWIAFQSARSKDPAGVGYGIFLLKVK